MNNIFNTNKVIAKCAKSDNDFKTKKEDHGEHGYLFHALLISICLDQSANT